jgi:hypothetical protein
MSKGWSTGASLAALGLVSAIAIYLAVGEVVRAGPGGAPAAAPDVPAIMTYQGLLTDPDTGLPVADDSYNMHFAIYDAPTDGTLLWQEPVAPAVIPVSTEGGLFTVTLGTLVPLEPGIFSGGAAYLEIQVAGETLAPRQRIASVPYSLVARNAETLAGLTPTDLNDAFVDVAGDTMTGNLSLPSLFAQNGSSVNTVSISGATATVRIGGTESEGNLIVADSGGLSVLDFDGNLASLRVGNTGNEGDIQVFNSDNNVVIDLDAEENAGDAGLRILDQENNQAFEVNAGTGDVTQSLPGDGLVKAAVRVTIDTDSPVGGTLEIKNNHWFNNVNGTAPTLSESAGTYTVDMGFDVSQRFVVCTHNPSEATKNATCTAGTEWSDPGSEDVNIQIWDPDVISLVPAEFNLLIY